MVNLFIGVSAALWLFLFCLIVFGLFNDRNFGFSFLGQKIIVVGAEHYDESIYQSTLTANKQRIYLNHKYGVEVLGEETKYPVIAYALDGSKRVTHGLLSLEEYESEIHFGHKFPEWERLQEDIALYKDSKITERR